MRYTINDEIYKRINKKVEDGTFKKGKNCSLATYSLERNNIKDYPVSERTPSICVSLMTWGECSFYDVPEASRTREFFISKFTNKEVFNYITNNIEKFDRDFFKDLLESNEYATSFDRNCFAIMPLEYIDEEMCSLAILGSVEWHQSDWFYSVYKRKPDALTSDLWKLGARLYARKSRNGENKFLSITPEECKDEEYYKEMCSSNFNSGVELDDDKGNIMDSVKEEILTPKFLLELLSDNINNVVRFNDRALEIEITYTESDKIVTEKIWQYVVKKHGYTIRFIKLNDERIKYFLENYDKDSPEYNYAFKDKYKKYKMKKEKDKNTKAILDASSTEKSTNQACLPIKFRSYVPEEYCKKYDSEEHLQMMYKLLGIQIIGIYTDLFYLVNMPEGWTITNEGLWYDVKDNEGNKVIHFFSRLMVRDSDAYVSSINIPEVKSNKNNEKTLVRCSKKRNQF